MNTTKTRDLAEVLADLDGHIKESQAAKVPCNAETLVKLTVEAVSHMGAIHAQANLATAGAQEAHRVAIEARDLARSAGAKPAAKPATKKKA